MIWGKTYLEKNDIGKYRNDIWVAWYPVRLKEDGRWVWGQKVKRFRVGIKNMASYKYYLLS